MVRMLVEDCHGGVENCCVVDVCDGGWKLEDWSNAPLLWRSNVSLGGGTQSKQASKLFGRTRGTLRAATPKSPSGPPAKGACSKIRAATSAAAVCISVKLPQDLGTGRISAGIAR